MPIMSRVILVLSTVYAACHAEAEEDTCEGEGCSVEFLQRGLHVDVAKTKTQLQLQDAGHVEIKGGFTCSSYPALCAAPFDCQTYDGPEGLTMDAAIAKDGSPNLHSWCRMPQYHEFLSQCVVEKDLVKAGHTQYENTKAGKHGPDTFQLDGSYCFIEGHCLNQAVHQDTSLDEAAAQCDGRFGHAEWTTFGDPHSHESKSFVYMSQKMFRLNQSNGFPSQEYTRGYLLLACAMGNYHCDVMMCKETYCKDPEMIKKHGHFLEDLGWTNNTEKWFVGASK
jgi:hypothetical protein